MTTTAETERALVSALDTIREFWDALLVQTSGGGSDGVKSSDPITGLDRRVSLRHEVTLTLNGWARLVVEELGLTEGIPLGTDAIGLADLLAREARWFSGHEAALDALYEVSRCALEVQKCAAASRAEWVHIGYCPTEDNGMACLGDVKAWPNAEPPLAPFCQRCGRVEYVDKWERILRAEGPLTHGDLIDFIREQFGREVERGTLRTWLHRGVISTIGVDENGQTLYDRGAVVYALTRRWAAWDLQITAM